MGHLDPLLEEIIAATLAVTALGGIIALLFWAFTGLSPWPMMIVAEIGSLGFGIVLLALASPRRR